MVRLLLLALLASSTAALAQGPAPPAPSGAAPVDDRVIITTHPLLNDSLDRLWQRSPTWRGTVDALTGTGLRVVVLPPEQVIVQSGATARRTGGFEPDLLAEVSPVADARGEVRQVLVVINVPLVEASHSRRRSVPADLHDDLDRILAHEVYGHALPYLLAGTLSGHCPDPRPGQRATDACAIQRENVIRAELGLGQRTDAGLYSLALARRTRH